jgi:hypothetical protein
MIKFKKVTAINTVLVSTYNINTTNLFDNKEYSDVVAYLIANPPPANLVLAVFAAIAC